MGGIGHIAAEHRHGSSLDGARARDQRQQAGLSHAIGANQADHATGGHVERDALKRVVAAIGKIDRGKTYDGLSRSDQPGGGRLNGHWASVPLRLAGHSAFRSNLT